MGFKPVLLNKAKIKLILENHQGLERPIQAKLTKIKVISLAFLNVKAIFNAMMLE
ncbi:MAG: hypothetical protein ACTSYC_03525 [Promethearchaeota archaeon]